MTPDEAEQILAETKVVPCFEAPLSDARALVEACLSANVPAQVHREACSKPNCSPKFQVLVRRDDAPQVGRILQQRWMESVRREGLVDVPATPLAQSEEGEPPCPACGTAAPLLSGACSDCGLQLE